jgi:class 3 adenylate cyclase
MASERAGYARTTDGLYIAYRVWGEKDPVHIFLSDFAATVDTRDIHPSFVRLWRTLAGISLVASLDRRGVGTSDVASPQGFELSDYVLDVLAVADAIGAERCVLTGEGMSGGAAAVAFAVAHPERVARLAIVNGTASFVRRDNYDLALFSRDDAISMIDHYFEVWGQGELVATFAPHLASDSSFIEVCGRIERAFCGPTGARMCAQSVLDLDLRDLAGQVTVPTLVYFTGDLAYVTVEQSRDLADRITPASLIEAPGRLFYLPDQRPQLDEFAEFIGGRIDPDPTIEACLVFVDVVGSTDHARTMGDSQWLRVLDALDAFVERTVTTRGGRVVKRTGDGHFVLFDRSADAVDAAIVIAGGVSALGIDVRTGVHLGDVRLRTNGEVGGISVHFATRVMNSAGPRQVYVSQRVVEDLSSAGAEFSFKSCGEQSLKGIEGRHRLFEAERN